MSAFTALSSRVRWKFTMCLEFQLTMAMRRPTDAASHSHNPMENATHDPQTSLS